MTQFKSSPEAEVEHSKNDYGFEHVGELLVQDDGNFDSFGALPESDDFVTTGISSSSEFLQGAVIAMADSARARSKRRMDAQGLGLRRSPEVRFWTMTIFLKCGKMLSLEMQNLCQWSCLGRKELQRQSFQRGPTS